MHQNKTLFIWFFKSALTSKCLSALLSVIRCIVPTSSFYTTKQAKQKIVSIAWTLEKGTIKSHKTFLNAWQIPLSLSRTNSGMDGLVYKSPFFLSFLKPVTAPMALTINLTLGQEQLTLPRVVWKLPYYWLVLCANGGYWLASLYLRATLQHIIRQPPPYKHEIQSVLGLRFKLY